jgi:hypothetical protein
MASFLQMSLSRMMPVMANDDGLGDDDDDDDDDDDEHSIRTKKEA